MRNQNYNGGLVYGFYALPCHSLPSLTLSHVSSHPLIRLSTFLPSVLQTTIALPAVAHETTGADSMPKLCGGTKKTPQTPTISDLLTRKFRGTLQKSPFSPCRALTSLPASPSRFPATVSTRGLTTADWRTFSMLESPPLQPR